ncbi:MAG: 2Fe-2S iron-sulfur cluster-binding protein [Pseudomonadota bacterium]
MRIELEEADGSIREIEAKPGLSVMEVLRSLELIDGECNGSLACATCHVWVDPVWAGTLEEPEEGEEDMLDVAFNLSSNSRLSCQIIMSDKTDGIRIALPRAI